MNLVVRWGSLSDVVDAVILLYLYCRGCSVLLWLCRENRKNKQSFFHFGRGSRTLAREITGARTRRDSSSTIPSYRRKQTPPAYLTFSSAPIPYHPQKGPTLPILPRLPSPVCFRFRSGLSPLRRESGSHLPALCIFRPENKGLCRSCRSPLFMVGGGGGENMLYIGNFPSTP